MCKINFLKWDTDYFGNVSGKITLLEKIEKNFHDKFNLLSSEYEFITIQNIKNNSFNNFILGQCKQIFLADINIQFSKNIKKNVSTDSTMKIFNGKYDPKIVDIAKNSFKYSRFFNDPYLKADKAKNIYVNWVLTAFEDKNRKFICYRRDNKILGFLLFRLDDDNAIIELIAVDSSIAGQGVGKGMIDFLEEQAVNNNCRTITVGTQVDNISAQNFYFKQGFKMQSCNSIYHWWNR